MDQTYNVYCDESCHLENDGQKAMVIGAVWCPTSSRNEIATRLREIKRRHGLNSSIESKWTKISKSKIEFYLDCVDYFFDNDDLHFRGIIIPNKDTLDHNAFHQDHDTWYYKMYFTMLKAIFDPASKYRVYIDIKDTLGQKKIEKLHEVLCHNAYDFSRSMIERVQRVQSHEVEHLQLADVLIGALSYMHRGLNESATKRQIIERIKQRSGYSLDRNTLLRETKFNLLVWHSGGTA
ncbi:DUF3800 domain-containing protein [Burkholderia multivorans]|uniref:DUF3800 domain-containing protein n=1 Tax=Burkholderia multivorans TaxID=87883 RepID=UPI0021C08ECC|nr:DUF3800 domain-containing protein [Burkholderia multivorans]